MKYKVHHKYIHKGISNDGDKSKHYFRVVSADNEDFFSVLIDRYILSNKDVKDFYGYKRVKKFKDYSLWMECIRFKIDTLTDFFNDMIQHNIFGVRGKK